MPHFFQINWSKNTILFFYSVFLSFISAILFFQSFSIQLDTNQSFVVGEATAHGISIGKRINSFYYTALVLVGTLPLFFYLLKKLFSNKEIIYPTEIIFLIIIQYTINITEANLFHRLDSFFCVNFFLLLFTIPCFLKKSSREKFFSGNTIYLLSLVFLTLFLLTKNGWIAAVTTLVLNFLIQPLLSIYKSIIILTILVIPVVLFTGIELTLILNQRGIFLPYYYHGIAASLILWLCIYRLLICKRGELVLEGILPVILTLVSFLLFTFYAPLKSWSGELFEMANELNPVMMSIQYQKLPVIDYMNSHLLADYFWHYFYILLNSFNHTQDPLIYKFMNDVSAFLIYFFLLRNILKNNYLAAFIILFVPYLFFYLPNSYSFVFLVFFSLYRYLQTFSHKRLFVLIVSFLFVAVWRLDMAVGLTGSFLIILPVYLYMYRQERKKMLMIIISFIFSAAGILLFVHTLNPDALPQMKHYFGASQAHGYYRLTYDIDNKFILHYFLLPFCIILITTLLLFNYGKWKENKYYLPLLFLIGFYFFNGQRGLVRHTFMEQNESSINSIAWIILLIFLLYFIKIRKLFIAAAIMPLALLFSVHNAVRAHSILNADRKLSLKELPDLPKHKIQRTVKGDWTTIWEVIRFLKKNTTAEESFIDFSSNPMLYYYTGKPVPSYFSQYIQNTVDGYLQETNIRFLKTQKLPFVVFQKVPQGYFDATDGIQNEVRYYRLTDYIYQHYEPYTMINDFQIWKLKSRKMPEAEKKVIFEPSHWNLGMIPYFWKEEKHQAPFQLREKLTLHSDTIHFRSLKSNDFLSLKIDSPSDQPAELFFDNSETDPVLIRFDLMRGTHFYKIPVGCAYPLIQSTNFNGKINSAEAIGIHNAQLKYLPFENK